jgi:PTS system fructose-specific IIC component
MPQKKRIVVLSSAAASHAHAQLAAEALKQTLVQLGHTVRQVIQSPELSTQPLSQEDISGADLLIIAADGPVDTTPFSGKPRYETRTAAAIRHTRAVVDAALALLPAAHIPTSTITEPSPEPLVSSRKRLVAITSCPTGIAHTFLAAEALKKGAQVLGHTIHVETQGSVGAQNALSPADIAAADAVIIAADTNVDVSRFAGKPIGMFSTKEAIHNASSLIRSALTKSAAAPGGDAALATSVEQLKLDRSKARTGVYKHLMTGVSHMLPVVIAGGLAIALAFAVGGIYAGNKTGTVGAALSQIGGGAAFHLMVAVLGGFIAYSIADRPGLAPGFVGGMLAQILGAGFLGGIAAGFLAGYLTKFLATRIKLPATLEGLKPVLILPFLSTISVGLLMIYVVAPPVQALLTALTAWLNAMRGTNAALLGLLLGAMMAFDMGGPVNKAAYTFAVGLLASQVYGPMAAVMAAGMTPPLGIALACLVAKTRFETEERKAGAAAAVLGLSFITEGAIPFAAKDPLRVIPALILGSATAGALSMVSGVQLLVPHGGVFAVLIPGAVTHLLAYLGAIAAGTILTAVALLALKRSASAPFGDAGVNPSAA